MKTSNVDHTIFKTPLLDHDKGKDSSSNSNKKGNLNYTSASHNNVINCFHVLNEHVSKEKVEGLKMFSNGGVSGGSSEGASGGIVTFWNKNTGEGEVLI